MQISPEQPAKPRLHLKVLDGIRGVSAFYVVLHHAYYSLEDGKNGATLDPLTRFATNWLIQGNYAVMVFIVLSGYCLMLPLAQRGVTHLEGGIQGFMLRRARRILPPYYAALALSLLLIWLVPVLGTAQGVRWDVALPALGSREIVSHILLVHNLFPDLIYKINYPLWSVAMEWQIYWVFCLLLVPAYRRFGLWSALPVASVAALTFFLLDKRYHSSGFHLILSFAIGMLGAISFAPKESRADRFYQAMPWGSIAATLTLLLIASHSFLERFLADRKNATDLFVSVIALCLILFCIRDRQRHPSGERLALVTRLFESPIAVTLGLFSYSVYLIHAPIIALIEAVVQRFGLSETASVWLILLLSIPFCLGLGYGFFWLFERPFLKKRPPQTKRPLADAAATEPAPSQRGR